ncbi:MAG: MFS transporter [Actinobacteria bacterium]|nr:MFS transporter [Actinomycetota bacterium]
MTEVGTTARGGMFRSLKSRNARLFFAGLLFSNIGSWLQLTATSFLLYRLTGSSVDLGVNAALQFLPMLILGAWAGAFSDRFDRRRTTVITQSLMAVQAIVLGVCDVAGVINVPLVFVLTGFLGVIGAIDNPSRRGLVTELVPPHEIGNAMSLNTAVMTGSRIFGPALAATLVGPLGTGWLFIINGISYVFMLYGLVGLRKTEMFTPEPRPAGGTPVRDGIRFVRTHQRLYPLFVVFAVVSTFAFNYGVSLPKLSDTQWGNAEYFGWVLAVTSVGSLIGALSTARLHLTTYTWVASAALMLGVANVGMAIAPNVWVAFVWALPLGAGGAAMIAGANSIITQEAPPDMRGRMLALTAVAFLGSTPIGGPITGWVADYVSVSWSLAYGGIITLLSAAFMFTWIWVKDIERG